MIGAMAPPMIGLMAPVREGEKGVSEGMNNWGSERLERYCKRVRIRRPENFDGIYVLGFYKGSPSRETGIRREMDPATRMMTYQQVAPDRTIGHHPLFEISLATQVRGDPK